MFEQLVGEIDSLAALSPGQIVFQILLGFLIFIGVLLLVGPFAFPSILQNNPQRPEKLALLTSVFPGQYKAKMRQGRFIGLINDGAPRFRPWSIWNWYEQYVWYAFGFRVIGVPGIQTLHTYPLPRLKKTETVENKREKEIYFVDDEKRSDHVRTRPFTFYFIVSGAEIQTVPFTITGSLQVRIHPDKVFEAFFNTDSWGIFLNQSVTATVRGVVRSNFTIDDVIGAVKKDIWDADNSGKADSYQSASREILRQLKERVFQYQNDKDTLKEIAGIDVISVEVTDFEPELSEKEQLDIRAAIRGRQAGRGRALEGQGEASFQKDVLAAAAEKGEHGHTSMLAEAIVRASKEGSLDALAAAFLKNLVAKK